MPFYLNDLDLSAQVKGVSSALIVSCYMCPAVTVAAREEKPFIRLFSSFVKSDPFEQYMKGIQSELDRVNIDSQLYRSLFLCMWPIGRRKKLAKRARDYDALVVLACDSAAETVRDAVKSSGCRVIKGMEVAGITNVKMSFSLPCNVSFKEAKMVAISQQRNQVGAPD